MRLSTTVRSPGSIGLGILFALGTCYVLFNDVTSLDKVSVDHVMTLLVLVGTIASGHMIWPQIRQIFRHPGCVVSAIGLAILFASGTFYCVTTSAGRNAEATSAKVANVVTSNGDRQRAALDLDEAKKRYKAALNAEEGECGSGEGGRCISRRKTTAARRAEIEAAEATLRAAPAERIVNGGTKHAAATLAIVLPAGAETIEHALDLLSPFVKALFLEIATLVFLGIGLGHKAAPAVGTRTVSSAVSPPPGGRRSLRKPSRFPETVALKPSATVLPFTGIRKPLTKGEALLLVQAEITQRGSIPSQDAIAERIGRRKGTVSRWLRDWERSGLVSRQQDGRCKVVASGW